MRWLRAQRRGGPQAWPHSGNSLCPRQASVPPDFGPSSKALSPASALQPPALLSLSLMAPSVPRLPPTHLPLQETPCPSASPPLCPRQLFGALQPCLEPSPAFRGRAAHSFTPQRGCVLPGADWGDCAGSQVAAHRIAHEPGRAVAPGPSPRPLCSRVALLGAPAFPKGLGIPQPALPLAVDALTGTATTAGAVRAVVRAAWGPPVSHAPPAPGSHHLRRLGWTWGPLGGPVLSDRG